MGIRLNQILRVVLLCEGFRTRSSLNPGVDDLLFHFLTERFPNFLGPKHLSKNAEGKLGVPLLEARGCAGVLELDLAKLFENHVALDGILRTLAVLVLLLRQFQSEPLVLVEGTAVGLLKQGERGVRLEKVLHFQKAVVADCQARIIDVIGSIISIDLRKGVVGPSSFKDIWSDDPDCVLGT